MMSPAQHPDQRRIAVAIALFWVTLFFRSPMLFLHPRFWAEEGSYYYAALQGRGFGSSFVLVVNGNFQLLTNWIAYCATLVPARFAAHVTTGLSLLVLGVFAGMVGLLSWQRRWPLPLAAVLLVNLALLPQGYELYLTGTNVQWICSACVLLLLLLDVSGWTRARLRLSYLLVIVAGLTGVCSVLLAPAFLLRKTVQPSAFHFRCGLILSACALLHALVIASTPHPGRLVPSELFFLSFPLALQTVWSPLLGGGNVDTLLAWIFTGPWPRLGTALIYLGALALAVFSLWGATRSAKSKALPWFLAWAWLSVSVLNVLGSLGNPWALVSGWAGGRYFFLGAICFLLLLAFVASNKPAAPSRGAVFLLALVMASALTTVFRGGWIDPLIRGESWEAAVERCGDRRPCQVRIWPASLGGRQWSVELQQR